jgi:hypothetical protein
MISHLRIISSIIYSDCFIIFLYCLDLEGQTTVIEMVVDFLPFGFYKARTLEKVTDTFNGLF